MDGRTTIQVVTFPARGLEERVGQTRVRPQLAGDDTRAAAFVRLHRALDAGADRLTLEVAVAEAIDALCAPAAANEGFTRPVQRALELLRERLAEPVTLDQLAAHANLDKFRLCRAFRAQIGMPPHAYLTRLRILRAKELLSRGTKPRDVAPLVGLYDQSQLNRHFRRIAGMTPGKYAR
jgi:transcriptional regulator GlxA family with amidase domain